MKPYALIGTSALASFALLSGCSIVPASADIYAKHVSNAVSGKPFRSAYDRQGLPVEGQINEAGVSLSWRVTDHVSVQQSLGYDISAGCYACMFGGPWLYEGRVSVRFFGRDQ